MSARVVLDASAVLAYLKQEPGADKVAKAIPRGIISSVNLAEVVSKLSEDAVTEEAVAVQVALLAVPVISFDERQALRTGALRKATAHYGLSLGDRACLALAEQERLPILTADRVWKALDLGLEVMLIR